MSNLKEMAMQFAIITYGRKDKLQDLGMFGLTITTSADQWDAELLLYNMERQFSPYSVQEAIKEAKETVQMVLPEGDSS